jgi:hypothetical protein
MGFARLNTYDDSASNGSLSCAKKLARSVGASPTQVRPSRPPGSECCVSRRRRRRRSVHGCCIGCVIEPRNRLLAGAENVFVIERDRGNAVMRGAARPAGVEEHITCAVAASSPVRPIAGYGGTPAAPFVKVDDADDPIPVIAGA